MLHSIYFRSLLILVAVSRIVVAEPIEFNRDIRPILSDNCFYCHGPDKNHREADLRLDLREEAVSSAAIEPGKPEASGMIERILSQDPDQRMPPPASNKKLSDKQKDLLRRWIEQGAHYQKHWAYEQPVKPNIPKGSNGVEVLVQQRLATLGIPLSPEADRRTLIRRLSFDLLGIPPKPEEVRAFENDPSPNAYEKLVDRILESPHYGERMAIAWLDVVRFADTIGYHSDNPRNIWPYRDWVIKSFNENKPFDRFTIEQIAGDLLEDANQETRVGSAFNRLLLTTEEGGAQPKDYEQRMLTDRVRAIGTAWLGQTTGCGQCHDHKFDPFTMRDFYSLGAFFADIQEPIIGRREEGMMVLDAEAIQRQKEIDERLASLRAEFERPYPELEAAQKAWEKASLEAASASGHWEVLKPLTAVTAKKNVVLKIGGDKIIRGTIDAKRTVRKQNDGTETYTVSLKNIPSRTTGFRFDAVKEKTGEIGLASNGNFVLSEVTINQGKDKPLAIARATATYEQEGFPAAEAIDGVVDQNDNGWGVFGGSSTTQSLYLELAEPWDDPSASLTLNFQFRWGDNHEIANLRINATTDSPPIQAPGISLPSREILDILALAPTQRTADQKKKIETAFKQSAAELTDLRALIANAEKAKADFENTAPRCLVSVSDSNRRIVRILPRGNWMDESGEIVKPALPHYLTSLSVEGRELNRLDLARWLVSRDNPLTARTVMNRLWKQFFGTGLSKVLDDLGAQGEPPVNGPLLDWLACEFMDRGWDMKHMVRTIVMSAPYRQVSTASPDLIARDPDNREVARQSPFRLEAELVRDTALTISGLLVAKIGGPSVKPYQPEGYWENLNFPPRTYPAEEGEGQYRRGLYTWWQRSFLHPSMLAFDAPTREECCAERSRSNIPQQALVLLNDPSYVEAARAFAVRILKESNETTDQRLEWAWQQALQRSPTSAEKELLLPLIDDRSKAYRDAPGRAEEWLKIGWTSVPADIDRSELAAWTHVARILFNLHETITRP